MAINVVTGVGCTLVADRGAGKYRVDTWIKTSQDPAMQRATYRWLSFTEAVDVMLTHYDLYRPFYALDMGSVQPTLPDVS